MNGHVCPHCRGRGTVELNGVYADTLALLRTMTEPISGAALARLARCPATAMNNRLAKLEEYGYARSRRYGRERLFEASKPPEADLRAAVESLAERIEK